MACKKFSLVVVMVAVMFLLSENVSGMTFSQPVKIGSIVAANMGDLVLSKFRKTMVL